MNATRVDFRRFEYSLVPIGAAHPHKTEAQVPLERLIAAGQRPVTDAAVLQEILHRYSAIDNGPALQVTLDIVYEVIPVEKGEVLRAWESSKIVL